MSRLYLVRHGRAEAQFGEAADPGLDEVGHGQAEAVMRKFGEMKPIAILTSPLLRARQTAEPLARHWGVEPIREEAVAEIPAPGGDLAERALWLKEFMAWSWRDAPARLESWRNNIVSALLCRKEDTVIFSHFITINAALGAAAGDDRVVVFKPDNGSVTVLDAADGVLTLIGRGREASTQVM